MSVPVQVRRPIVDDTRILVGAPVAAPSQWSDIAAEAMWIKGKGAQLVPAFSPMTEIKTTAERIYRFRVKPRLGALQRIWTIAITLDTGGTWASTGVAVRVPATTGPVQYATASYGGAFRQIRYVENLAAQSAAQEDISIGIVVDAASVSAIAHLVSVACFEQDRPALVENGTDLPVSPETVRPGEPIGVDIDYTSLGGVLTTLGSMDARRVGIFQWSTPSPVSRLSATPAAIFDIAPFVQAPKIGIGDTTGTVRWAVYAAMSAGGGGGAVSLTTTSGASDSISVTSATAAWIDGGTFAIYCDDFTAIDGKVNDALALTHNGDGTRSVQVYAISIWVESVA